MANNFPEWLACSGVLFDWADHYDNKVVTVSKCPKTKAHDAIELAGINGHPCAKATG
jgi:hypothetical protein